MTDLHIGFYATGAAVIGGAERQVAELSRHVAKKTQTTVFLDPRQPEGLYTDQFLASHDAHFLHLPEAQGQRSGALAAAAKVRRLRRVIQESGVDVVVQRVATWNALYLALACRAAGVPFVYHWASDHDGRLRDLHLPPRIIGPLGFLIGRKLAHAQITITRKQQAMAGRGNVHVLPDLVAERDWQPSRGSDVLWVARIKQQYKQPHLFLDLAEALPERHFVMAGAVVGPADFQSWFRDRLAGLPNVEHLGEVGHDDMPAVYSRARMLVNTSNVEGFCNAFLEAASCEVPTVSLNHDPNGILSERGAGICVGGDTSALPGAVESLYDDVRHAACRKACREVAAEHRGPAVADQFLAIMDQIVKGS